MNIPTIKPMAIAISLAIASYLAIYPVHAADLERFITIKNHSFEPSVLTVQANQRIKLTIQNLDATPEEFESHALNREKLIPAGAKAVLYLGPLQPGRYEFMGEFNPTTATGVVIAEQ
jgi:hypothetical protein